MEYPTDRLIYAAIVLVLSGVVYSTVQATMPDVLTNELTKIHQVIDKADPDGGDTNSTKLTLQLNLPDQHDVSGSFYTYHVGTADSFNYIHHTPIFEPNTFDLDQYNNTDGFIEPTNYFNYTGTAQEWADSVNKYEKENNYNDTNYTSPFIAKDSKGNDITKSVRFKSVKLDKIETVDGKNVTSNVDSLKFNQEFTNYGDLLEAMSKYNTDHQDEAESYKENHTNDTSFYTYIKKIILYSYLYSNRFKWKHNYRIRSISC